MNHSFQYCLLPHNSYRTILIAEFRAYNTEQQLNRATAGQQTKPAAPQCAILLTILTRTSRCWSQHSNLQAMCSGVPHCHPMTARPRHQHSCHQHHTAHAPAEHQPQHSTWLSSQPLAQLGVSPRGAMVRHRRQRHAPPPRNESPSIGSVFELAVCRPIAITRRSRDISYTWLSRLVDARLGSFR